MTTANLEKRILEERQYIQDVGILFEEFNLPRIAGRILGYLLICDPPYQNAGELLSSVGGSKGSISSMTKLLIHTGSIERTSVIGKRGTYYRIKSGSLTDLLTMRMFFLKSMRQLAEKGLNIIGDTSTLQYKRLKEIRDLYAFFENEWPALLERWERKRRK